MSTTRCLAKDIFDAIAATTEDAGVCPTSEAGKATLLRQINLACKAMVKRIDSEGLIWDFTVPVWDGCFALPEDCAGERQIFVNGTTAVLRDKWYEGKLAWGRNSCGTDCRMQCIDQGQYAIPLPLPKAHSMRIAVLAEANADIGKVVTLELIDQYGHRIVEQVTLLEAGTPAVTNSMVYDVTMVNKPETVGAIQLQVHYDDGQRFFIGKGGVFARYGPKVRNGTFRRKKLPSTYAGCNQVVIRGKLKVNDITHEDDVLPFDDVMAWRFAVMAIDAQTRGNLGDYDANLRFALNEIGKSMADADPAGNQAVATFHSGFGGVGTFINRRWV